MINIQKVLFLPLPNVSHAMDTLYRGMVELLGGECVFDYPRVEKYHRKDLFAESDPYGFWCYYDNPKAIVCDFNQVIEMIKNEEITHIIGSHYTLEGVRDILNGIDNYKIPKIYIIDESEGTTLHEDYTQRWSNLGFAEFKKHNLAILKIDLLQNQNVGDYHVKPLHMGCPLKVEKFADVGFEGQEKMYDVCYWVGKTNPYREEIHQRLENIKDLRMINHYGGMPSTTYQDYLRMYNASKICISVRGLAWSTDRYVTVPLLKSMLLSERLPTIVPNDYTDGVDAVFFKPDLSDLEEKIKYYIEHEDERLKIAKAGYEHAKQYLSTMGMAKYVLGVT